MARSKYELVDEALRYLEDNSDITFTQPGSVARALVEAVVNAAYDVLVEAENLRDQSFLPTAYGEYLDRFGEWLGVPRLSATPAVVVAEDRVIRFYVTEGTLYSKLGGDGSGGYIPKGTRIYNSSGDIVFTVTEDAHFDRAATEVYVSAACNVEGATGNVGKGVLTQHSLGVGGVFVTNEQAITSGTEGESDGDYRIRLALAFRAVGGSRQAIGLALSRIPGVSDYFVREQARGAGTFDVVLIPSTSRVSELVKDTVAAILDSVAAVGVSIGVREPEYVPISMAVRLIFDPNSDEAGHAAVRVDVERTIIDYIANIPVGGWLIIDQLIARVLGSYPVLQDIKIDELIIDSRPQLVRDYKLPEDGIFVIDSNIPFKVN